jgi:hypothetical protein
LQARKPHFWGNACIFEADKAQSMAWWHDGLVRRLREGVCSFAQARPDHSNVRIRTIVFCIFVVNLSRFDSQMFPDNTPAGAEYIVTNDKGEKVFWLLVASSECIVILFAGFYSSPRPRIPRLGCRFRSRVNWVSQLGSCLTVSAARYKDVSAHLDGVPESAEAQQQCVIFSWRHIILSHDHCFRYWQEFLSELRKIASTKFGAEFVDDCLRMELDDVKDKYGSWRCQIASELE